MHSFRFNLGDRVKLVESDETGIVTGRAQYEHSEDAYYVRYRAGDGRQVEAWWGDSAIASVSVSVSAG